MTIQEQRRKAFEERFLAPDGVIYNADKNAYQAEPTEAPEIYVGRVGQASFYNHGWKIWNAALDSVEIELPDPYTYSNPDTAGAAIFDCATSIKASGVKVKP